MKNLLCIGGPLAGKWVRVSDGMDSVEIAELLPLRFAHTEVLPTETITFRIYRYNVGSLRDNEGKDHLVLVLDGVNIIEELLRSYDQS